MSLNFPSTPSANATYSFNNKTWTYTGNAWKLATTTLSTSVVAEGTNLYFTNARSRTALTQGSRITLDANGLISAAATFTGSITPPSSPIEGNKWLSSNTGIEYTYIIDGDSSQWVELGVTYSPVNTSNVEEGINLYFTNTRAIASLTAGTGISINTNGLVSSTVTDGGSWTIKTSNYTANNREWIYADTTSGAITITLPASPVLGNYIKIGSGPSASSNTLTIGRNNSTIMNLSENMDILENNISVDILYDGSTWRTIR